MVFNAQIVFTISFILKYSIFNIFILKLSIFNEILNIVLMCFKIFLLLFFFFFVDFVAEKWMPVPTPKHPTFVGTLYSLMLLLKTSQLFSPLFLVLHGQM